MRRFGLLLTAVIAVSATIGLAQNGPYKVIKTAKVGGNGGFDYVNADSEARRLYVARRADQASGQQARINVFNLDTLAPAGVIANVSAHGVAIDPKSGHGIASSKPVTLFDTKTLAVIKTIDVEGSPDGLLFDPFDARVHVLSHSAPNDTVINTADGSVVGTIDLGGAPEQAASDGKGTIYVDLEDKDAIAVVDAKNMKVTATYDVSATCGGPAGLGLDAKNKILFATCHTAGKSGEQGKATMVVVNATTGAVLATLPIGQGTDGGGFNPATMEAFSSHSNGTLTVVKETSPTTFEVEENLQTMLGARTLTLDTKTNRIFVMSVERGPAPPPPPGGGRGGQAPAIPGSFTILMIGK
jgi:hypothetical protein